MLTESTVGETTRKERLKEEIRVNERGTDENSLNEQVVSEKQHNKQVHTIKDAVENHRGIQKPKSQTDSKEDTKAENNEETLTDPKQKKSAKTEQKPIEENNKKEIEETVSQKKSDKIPKNEQKQNGVTNRQQTEKARDNVKQKLRYQKNGQKEPKDCYDHYLQGNKKNSIYKIRPYGLGKDVQVFCDMKGGGWTLLQKRSDGTTKFFRDWQDYKTGFGGPYGEHWIGNDNIHYLTNQDHYKLRIELTDWTKTMKHAEYSLFSIGDEKDGYKLSIGGYTGNAGDGMAKHNGHKFSTKDVDNDKVVKEFGGSCAKRFNGAWWYYKCYMSNLNGIYYRNGQIPAKMFDGITWKPWMGPNYSLRSVEMKIRPRSAEDK